LRIFSRAENRRATLDPLSQQGGVLPRVLREARPPACHIIPRGLRGSKIALRLSKIAQVVYHLVVW
jgi:hypothetical protein